MSPIGSSTSPVVAVIGLGYIGLPTAAILATHGAEVIGVDVNQATVDAVNRGEVPFVEPDLEISVAGAVSQGRLRADVKTPPADVFVVAVPTPFADDHAADLSYIEAAADALAPQLQGGELVILESTSPPGATQHMADRILAARPDLSLHGRAGRPVVHFAHCPERVLPGRVMVELVTNDRIVGGLTRVAAEKARDLYATFCKGEIMLTDAKTAEMAKLVENSFRDVNIAFANELSMISDKLAIDVWELIELANHHPRVNILQPGPGVGGHCIAVDPWFIVSSAPDEARLIRTAREVNDDKPERVISKVVEKARRFRAPRIAALGLAFKPDIDDLRESPARRIVAELAKRLPEAQIDVVEPHIEALPRELSARDRVDLVSLRDAVDAADIVLLLVDHTQFKEADERVLGLAEKVVIDTRGVWRG
ncbi:UDP-N-acetyl-D-mannosamine dehydrogenase [Cellulomonas sp. zg-ZUI199]|uniref:UDP-N-acetyl-D-mannosamine dehydrogenase n=1 Tax=Cellulomonas wangleii TaxID=2816956 RepID=A0ABX8D8C6_9CELL|nr:UDP-N-acetyl-D-mannosamine dehydrogenase [Cellulomonas wangleii]MBO0924925.1 UDP-N-acetyl-D-mannosamine dehydrogenase [Cellulomonas wangleii]MBO0926813.1 UDP-N-acetyl-D-mannosamine dehydrogenase [Cellulomonas wangleii]QVI63085.1 UDP-N-acetyl-D-mannosamine dehydrogenase [Cellulomonas wangleii]